MNYSEMSDFEINCFVAEELGMKPFSTLGWKGAQEGQFTAAISKGPNKIGAFDPCNSWADAGPIIAENQISIVFDADTVIEPPANWVMCRHVSEKGDITEHYGRPENPLRAAMIVFLMMQEEK